MKRPFFTLTSCMAILMYGCTGNKASIIESSVHVWGNCEKCKSFIEKSCALNGVSEAVWDVDSKLLKLKLDTSVISSNTVLQAVSKAGYDNETYYADDYAYNALPECCQYERRPFESK